jgi:hypothetical protein
MICWASTRIWAYCLTNSSGAAPNAEAIAQMSLENYEEMRDRR